MVDFSKRGIWGVSLFLTYHRRPEQPNLSDDDTPPKQYDLHWPAEQDSKHISPQIVPIETTRSRKSSIKSVTFHPEVRVRIINETPNISTEKLESKNDVSTTRPSDVDLAQREVEDTVAGSTDCYIMLQTSSGLMSARTSNTPQPAAFSPQLQPEVLPPLAQRIQDT